MRSPFWIEKRNGGVEEIREDRDRDTDLEASISTRLAGSPSRHLTQCAAWPALLRAGNRGSSDTDAPVATTDVDSSSGGDMK